LLLDSSDLVEAKASAHKAKAWTFEAGQGHENMASRHVKAKASAHKAKAWTFEAGQGHENMASRHVKAKAWARPERTMFSLGKKS